MNTTKSLRNTQNNLLPKNVQEYIKNSVFKEMERQIKTGEAFGKRNLKREKITTYERKKKHDQKFI